jgi:hypothetical protein
MNQCSAQASAPSAFRSEKCCLRQKTTSDRAGSHLALLKKPVPSSDLREMTKTHLTRSRKLKLNLKGADKRLRRSMSVETFRALKQNFSAKYTGVET